MRRFPLPWPADERRSTRLCALLAASCSHIETTATAAEAKRLFQDVHELGKVEAKAVAEAHQKDLATQGKYDVAFKAYGVDESHGRVYCLSEAPSADAVKRVHAEAHGLLPDSAGEVVEGH